eukprot:TRINITY_DN3023_c1_g1_i1.p1 TRINITY_DN3023_c1_g1~~TRINITY_DN3023_c1_g1_i1.p1  ORF type:complete len:1740 (-),score=488.09 TRINITY_DN3023_c1_g1_i1:24-5243(-)
MSLFSRNKDKDKDKEPQMKNSYVLKTGNQIDDIAQCLVQSAHDGDDGVRRAMAAALHDVGFRQTALVVSSALDWMMKNGTKGAKGHKVMLLECISKLVSENRDKVSPELAADCTVMAAMELTRDKDVVPDLQEAACGVLVSLTPLQPDLVLDELIKRFEPGSIPHYFVIKTLGDVFSAEPLVTVHRMKEVLSRLIPIIAGIKYDHMKWVIATAVWQFCEAIQSYIANIDKGKDKTLSLLSFSSEMFPTYEVLFTKWSTASDKKLKVAVVKAIGNATSVFNEDQYARELPKIVPALLKLLKSEKEMTLPMTQGLCTVLDVGARLKSPALNNEILGMVATTLLAFVCSPPDYSNQNALKNFNESLRCFEVIGRGFPEFILSFVLPKLETRDVTMKVGCLTILKHLINSIDSELTDKKGLIVSGVRPLILNETNPAVKRALAQLFVALAPHDYLSLEGGESLIEFIVRCCSVEDFHPVDKKPIPPEVQSLVELRDVCDNVLQLATTTISSISQVLWPYLFELLISPKYTAAVAIICRCLSFVANKKRESQDPDYYIDFEKNINLPKPQQILAKLLFYSLQPHRRGNVGKNIVELLKAIGSAIVPTASDMWDEKLPKIISFLSDHPASCAEFGPKSRVWEEMMFEFLDETLKLIDDDEWLCVFGNAITAECDSVKDGLLRRGGLKLLGVALQRVNKKDYIREKVDYMMNFTNHVNEEEREGFNFGLSYAGSTHLDIVLEKITEHYNAPAKNKKQLPPTCYWNCGVANEATLVSSFKNSLILSFGQVSWNANIELISSRIEIQIVPLVKAFMLQSKSPQQKDISFRCFSILAKTMHPSHLKSDFIFKARDEIVKSILDCVSSSKDQEINNSARLSCLECLIQFVLLPPLLNEDVETNLLSTTSKFLSLASAPPSKDQTPTIQIDEIWDPLFTLFVTCLGKQCNVAKLCKMFQFLEGFICSVVEEQRQRSVDCSLLLTKKFVQFTTGPNAAPRNDPSFSNLGPAIALFVPRCCDNTPKVRRSAVNTLGMILFIDHLLRNGQGQESIAPSATLKPLNAIRDRAGKEDISDIFGACHELAKVLSESVSQSGEDLEQLVSSLIIRSLKDCTPRGSEGTCVVLNTLMKTRGGEMVSYIVSILDDMLDVLKNVTNETVINGSMSSLRSLSHHHLIPMVKAVLDQPQPHSPMVVRVIQTLSSDKNLFERVLNHLLFAVNNSRLHDEKPDKKRTLIPLDIPMAATAALEEMFKTPELSEVLNGCVEKLLPTVLMRIGTSICEEAKPMPQAKPNKVTTVKPVVIEPIKQSVEALKSLLAGTGLTLVKQALDEANAWSKFESPEHYQEAMALVADSFARARPEKMNAVFDFTVAFLRGNYAEQKVVASIIFTEFMNNCKDSSLIQKLLDALMGALCDPIVKLYVLRGLGNLASAGEKECNKHATTVLDALTSSIEDSNEIIAMEAMIGLAKFIEDVDENKVSPILVNLCHRIRPIFEKENPLLRSASVTLFGALARFGGCEVCNEKFQQQAMTALPSLVLHLYDFVPEVQQSVKVCLRRLSLLIRSSVCPADIIKKALAVKSKKAEYNKAAKISAAAELASRDPDSEAEKVNEEHYKMTEEEEELCSKAFPLVDFFAKRMFDSESPMSPPLYDRAVDECSKILINDFPQNITSIVMGTTEYFRVAGIVATTPSRIKANASIFVGFCLSNLPVELRGDSALNTALIAHSLITLIGDKDAYLRTKATEAMALLHTY